MPIKQEVSERSQNFLVKRLTCYCRLKHRRKYSHLTITDPNDNFISCITGSQTSSQWKMFQFTPSGESPKRFFNPSCQSQFSLYPVIPMDPFSTQVSRACYQSRILPPYYFKIPNPNLHIRPIPHPGKPIGNPRYALKLRARRNNTCRLADCQLCCFGGLITQ